MNDASTASNSPTALIADDEPLLSAALAGELSELWPQLHLLEPVADGLSAIDAILQYRPQIAFLDIRMPGADGLQVAQAVIDEWDDLNTAEPLPRFVFVTAYDEHAVRAYELAALDYVTKPVTRERLAKTVDRLQQSLSAHGAQDVDKLAGQLGRLLAAVTPGSAAGGVGYLSAVRASVGDAVRLIPIDNVVMFEAADKYVNVATADADALIRESLRELKPQLDPAQFVQIHRSRIVNLSFVSEARRSEDGKLRLTLKERSEKPVVSRVFAHLFKAM